MGGPVEIPAGLYAFPDRGPAWSHWLSALPGLVDDVLAEWGLDPDGSALHGFCAMVQPVTTRDGTSAVAKFSWAVDEQEHEYLGLRRWDGDGVVQLYRDDPARGVLLLERLHADRDLAGPDHIDACVIAAGFYRRLHVAAPAELRPLSSYIERWSTDLARLPADDRLPYRLVDQAVRLGRDLVADGASGETMIHGDLHFENVLAADREPWLVIDPKPMSGDPHYEVAALLWNRWDDAVATGDVQAAVRRRLDAIVDTAGLDRSRARQWTVVRALHNAMWCLEDHPFGLDAEARSYLEMCTTLADAVQP